MRKISMFFMALACTAFLTGPVWAADNPRPNATQLVKSLAERNGESVPQGTAYYMLDLVTNSASYGYSTVFVLTNYNATSRMRIRGWVIPKGALPGGEKTVDIWLEPYGVKYVDLNLYLGNENGWALLYSVDGDFGCGALIFNTESVQGLTWVKPWYWYIP
jgi:hypothetical protein